MNIKLIKPIVTGAATLALLCSCGGNGKVSLSQFIKKAKENNMLKYVVYDKCTLSGSYSNVHQAGAAAYPDFKIVLNYNPATIERYLISQTETTNIPYNSPEAYVIMNFFILNSIGNLYYAYFTGYDDKAIDSIGRYIEARISPYSLKGSLQGDYIDFEYDPDGMPKHIHIDQGCTGVDIVCDFTITHDGDRHEF